MGFLYLRDLKTELQNEYLESWGIEGRKDLLKAHEEGTDIEVGDYYKDKDEKVVQ